MYLCHSVAAIYCIWKRIFDFTNNCYVYQMSVALFKYMVIVNISGIILCDNVDVINICDHISLIYWDRVAHMRVSKPNNPWFRYSPAAWSAPSHYLTHRWYIAIWTLGNKLKWNNNGNSNIFIYENTFEIVVCQRAIILCHPHCVN